MTAVTAAPALSDHDRQRVEEVERLAKQGSSAVTALLGFFAGSSWAVRRALVATLAAMGDDAVEALCREMRLQRGDDPRLSGIIEALTASTGAVDGAVIALAQDADPAIVCDAVQILGRRASHAAIPTLCALTDHRDDNVALAAVEALGRIGGAEAVDSLLALASSGSFFRTFPAIDVLGRSGDSRAVPELARLLRDPIYASEAARALGRLGNQAAAGPLADALARGGDALVRAAALALVEIHDRCTERFGAAASIERALAGHPGAAAIRRRLTECIRNADAAEQIALSRVLGWVADDEVVPTLIPLLDGTPAVAGAAAAALAGFARAADPRLLKALREGDSAPRRLLLPLLGGLTSALPDVMICLDDEVASVRALACEAIARTGDPRAVRALFERLDDPDLGVSQAALAAIQSLGSAEVRVLALDAARSENLTLRRYALRIIAYFAYPEAFDVLVDALRGEDERSRDVVIAGLPSLDDARVLDVLLEASAHPSARTRAAATRALGQTSKDPRVTSRLLETLDDPEPWVRYYACQSLGKLGHEDAADRILERIHDPAGQVRAAAIDALAHLTGERALEALRAAARSEDPDLRRTALVGIGISRRRELLPLLVEASQDAEAASRLMALSAISEFDGPETVTILARAAGGDRDESVRDAAIESLGRHSGSGATQALIDLLDKDQARERVLSALSTHVDGRVAALAGALASADDRTATALVGSLARMRRADASAAILAALHSQNDAARRAAAAALTAAGDPDSNPALQRAAATDPDPEVRRICALALTR